MDGWKEVSITFSAICIEVDSCMTEVYHGILIKNKRIAKTTSPIRQMEYYTIFLYILQYNSSKWMILAKIRRNG